MISFQIARNIFKFFLCCMTFQSNSVKRSFDDPTCGSIKASIYSTDNELKKNSSLVLKATIIPTEVIIFNI